MAKYYLSVPAILEGLGRVNLPPVYRNKETWKEIKL